MMQSSQTTYCQRWNDLTHGPIKAMSEKQAQKLDASGQPYVALLGDKHKPDAIVEVNWSNNHVGVWFLDDELRRYLKYTFTKVNDSIMFMDGLTLWEYPDETDSSLGDLITADVVTTFTYQPNGVVREARRDSVRGEDEIVDRSDVALDINWEPVPTFGNWDSVARLDREPSEGK